MSQAYIKKIQEMIRQLAEQQAEVLQQAAEQIAQCVAEDGIIYIFGCGHSHLLAEEGFYRAGTLVPIYPILEESLMLHEGAVRSSELEKKEGYAYSFAAGLDIQPKDVVLVASTSGRNAVPIDMALIAKEKGAYVIGITSLAYSQSQPSRHNSGQTLADVVDLVLDNYAVKGDAVLTHNRIDVPFGPVSTVTGAIILHSMMTKAIQILADKGMKPPVFLSGNVDGARGHNQQLIQKYASRIPMLNLGLET